MLYVPIAVHDFFYVLSEEITISQPVVDVSLWCNSKSGLSLKSRILNLEATTTLPNAWPTMYKTSRKWFFPKNISSILAHKEVIQLSFGNIDKLVTISCDSQGIKL